MGVNDSEYKKTTKSYLGSAITIESDKDIKLPADLHF
jgi:hypothetical protein